MTIEELRAKVEAANQKVEKCRKTIERHKIQMEKKAKQLRDMGIDPDVADKYSFAQNNTEINREAYWLLCDYDNKKDDIKGAESKLADAERICANWKEKLDFEINKEKIIENTAPQVIKDFLEDWKKKSFEWYVIRHASFLDFRTNLRQEERDAKIEALKTLPEYADLRERFGEKLYEDFHINNPWPRKPMENFLKERNLDYRSIKERLGAFADQIIMKMCEFRDEDERRQWLDGALEQEKKAKLFVLITQINNITGLITDAKHLYVSGGELNGVILGEKGVAKIQTFSAGGYNIQCFHYRTRVDDVTDKYRENPTPFKYGERICTYQFPRFEGGDDMVAQDYGLEVIGNTKDDTLVKGQYRDILAFADQHLGYQLVPEYLKDVIDEKPRLDDVIGKCAAEVNHETKAKNTNKQLEK